MRAPILRLIGISPTPLPRWSLSFLAVVLLAIIIGAATHNIWDSISHMRGWTVQRVEFLRADVLGLPVYKYIQYGSGVFGLLALVFWAKFEFPGIGLSLAPARQLRIAAIILLTCIVALSVLTYVVHGFPGIEKAVANEAIALLSGVFVAALMYATIERMRSG